MILKTFEIENFRGIAKLTIELDRTTVLIGENNSGKTSVLEALHTCMNRGLSRRATPFSEYDFHLATEDAEPADAPPIVLTLTFEESKADEWPDELVQAFPNAIQTLDDDRQRLSFRVTAKYDKATRDFAVEWSFLDKAGSPLPTAKQAKLVTDLQQLAPVFLLTAVRDASQHFQSKSALWGPFTKNPQISEEKQKEIEEQIEQINQSVLDSHKPFEVIKDRIAQTGKLVPLANKDLASVEAVPTRIFDMLARTQVKLGARTGARLPIAQHGAGTQSLAVLFLFEAFLQSRLADAYDKHSEPILALEEPESHLHPSAIRALWSTLDKLAGQKIIATHSGDLLASVPLKAIRRLARKNGTVEVFKVKDTTLDSRESEQIAFHVRAKRGSLFFARCWLFLEGESEFSIIPELAQLLKYDFEHEGVCCIDFVHCPLSPLIKVADDLGIAWHLLSDGDKAGLDYARTANTHLGTRSPMDHVTTIPDKNLEHHFWVAGYAYLYENSVLAKHKHLVTAAKGTPDYVAQTIKAAEVSMGSKPSLALAVLNEIRKPGSPGVPTSLKTSIEAAVKLARASA
jgi:putative ATP-dependent endonuclease of OLD family